MLLAGRHAEEESARNPRGREGCDRARRNSSRRHSQTVSHHQPDDRAAIGAERDPDPDFPRAPRDVVRQHGVDTDDRERERQRGEDAE